MGAIVYGVVLLLVGPRLEALCLIRVVRFSMSRGAPLPVKCDGGGGVCLNASTMVGCREALATVMGHGLAGRLS